MSEKLGAGKDNQDKRTLKAGMGVVAGLSVGLAAGGANAQDAIQPGTDYAPDSYEMDYTSSYEFSGSDHALKAVEAAKTISSGKEAAAVVKSFMAQYPFAQGETITAKDGGSSGSSYDPLLDLRAALETKVTEMNPLVAGLLWQAIKKAEKQRFELEHTK